MIFKKKKKKEALAIPLTLVVHTNKWYIPQHVLYCILVIHYNFKLCLLHNLFSCNCKEVQIDTQNEFSFWMFRISLDSLIIIGSNRYSLPITLFTKSYSNACLRLLSQLFACLIASMHLSKHYYGLVVPYGCMP